MSKIKHSGSPVSPVLEPRNIPELMKQTGNTYETIAVISKRANQISAATREELHSKLEEFATTTDSLEEVQENREQIEISRFYEKLPNPSLVATQEFLEGKVYFRNPAKEKIEGLEE